MKLKFTCKLIKLLNVYTLRFNNYSKSTMVKKALVFLAPGAEEMEFVIAVDILRRGGVDVTVAGLPDSLPIPCSRGVNIIPDVGIEATASKGLYDALVLPGGLAGSQALCDSKEVGILLKQHETAGKIIAAICAAPTALRAHNIGRGKNITCYPSVKDNVCEGTDFIYLENSVVVDGNITTSRGPGTAIEFALNLVEQLEGKKKAHEVAVGMLLTYPAHDKQTTSDNVSSKMSDKTSIKTSDKTSIKTASDKKSTNASDTE